jgi:hypothetical protein
MNLFRTAESSFDSLPPPFSNVLINISLKNPEYKLYYFSKEDRLMFMKKRFPEYLGCYESLIPGAFQSDLFRLLVLYAYGGIYSDIGQRFLTEVRNIVRRDDEFVSVKEMNNWGINQGFIASYPRHPLISMMIQVVVDMIRRRDYSDCPIDITGPYAVFRAFNKFFQKNPYAPLTDGSQSINGYRVRFLNHVNGPGHDEVKFICSDPTCELVLIQNKFRGYREALQNMSGIRHYSDLWRMRNVFSNSTARSCHPVTRPMRAKS